MADAYSNPLPPPPRPGAPPALAHESSTPKSNADFRALLTTPRAERGSYTSTFGGSSSSRGGAKNDGGGDSAEKKEKKSRKPYRPKPAAEEAKKDDDGPAYRDRAEERRKGVNPDYDGFSADMSAGGSAAVPGGNLTIDETKFLGGDVEHTHLVKGLDYALLQKVRTEESARESEEAEEARARAKMLKTKEFKTPLGRQVFQAIFQPPKRDVSQMFLPRRTAFVYDLEDGEALDIPTTLHRSKADCPKPKESMLGVMDGAVLERLAKIMGYMRVAPGAKLGKRLKKREKQRMLDGGTPIGTGGAGSNGLRAQHNGSEAMASTATADAGATVPPPPPMGPADDDDNIFGGVGANYELPEKRSGGGTGAGPKSGTYFEKKDQMRDLPAIPTGNGAADDMVPPPPPDMPPPPPPADTEAAPGPAMPPPGYDYDYSAAYGAVPADAQQQWAQQQYDASAYDDPTAMQYDAYGQPMAYQAVAIQGADANRELTTGEKEAGLGSVFKRDDERLSKIREKDEREKDPNFVSDAYAECYPAFHEFGTTIVDSDEEDLSHMDKKGEKNATRADFNTEEEWQAHKAKQETLPKAAFQFGLKMADGRKTHKSLLNKAAKADNKLKNELNSIKDILDKKGGNYGRAFEAEPEPAGGGKPAKRKRVI